jgi:general secretion pathway protein G
MDPMGTRPHVEAAFGPYVGAAFRRPKLSTSGGFTLIELLVVMSLLVILAAIGLMTYSTSMKSGKEAVLKTDLFQMREAIDQHYADKGKYPLTLQDLVSAGYLRKIPEDPMTGSAETWQTVMSEPDPNNPTAEPGIYDVKSGSEEPSLDGTNYSEW